MTDQIEKSDAERVKYLAELARLRGVSLTALIEELGIRPLAYDPLLQLAGVFEADITNMSERHDEYIGQGLRCDTDLDMDTQIWS